MNIHLVITFVITFSLILTLFFTLSLYCFDFHTNTYFFFINDGCHINYQSNSCSNNILKKIKVDWNGSTCEKWCESGGSFCRGKHIHRRPLCGAVLLSAFALCMQCTRYPFRYSSIFVFGYCAWSLLCSSEHTSNKRRYSFSSNLYDL